MTATLADRVETVMWDRHSNPKSGWSRVPTGPVVLCALYRRNWGLLLGALAWAALNPLTCAHGPGQPPTDIRATRFVPDSES